SPIIAALCPVFLANHASVGATTSTKCPGRGSTDQPARGWQPGETLSGATGRTRPEKAQGAGAVARAQKERPMAVEERVNPAALAYKPEDYAYSVMWSEADQAYIGRVLEFPSLAAHGPSPVVALQEMTNVVRYVL